MMSRRYRWSCLLPDKTGMGGKKNKHGNYKYLRESTSGRYAPISITHENELLDLWCLALYTVVLVGSISSYLMANLLTCLGGTLHLHAKMLQDSHVSPNPTAQGLTQWLNPSVGVVFTQWACIFRHTLLFIPLAPHLSYGSIPHNIHGWITFVSP